MKESSSHPWFQFSLGRLLICITFTCVALVFWRGLGFGAVYLTILCGGAFALAAWRGPKEIPIVVAASLQVLAAAMFLFAPIGFDHHSEWGRLDGCHGIACRLFRIADHRPQCCRDRATMDRGVDSNWNIRHRIAASVFGSHQSVGRTTALRSAAALAAVLACWCAAENTYRPIFKMIPDGVEPSLSWVSSRRLSRWTTGSIE